MLSNELTYISAENRIPGFLNVFRVWKRPLNITKGNIFKPYFRPDAYLVPSQKSNMELCFHKKALSLMFDWFLNAVPLSFHIVVLQEESRFEKPFVPLCKI